MQNKVLTLIATIIVLVWFKELLGVQGTPKFHQLAVADYSSILQSQSVKVIFFFFL